MARKMYDPSEKEMAELTNCLLVGFPELDRLEHEIKTLVTRIVGLAEKIKGPEMKENLWSPTYHQYSWQVSRDRKGRVAVQCLKWAERTPPVTMLRTVYSTHPHFVTDGATQLAMENIEGIHDSLSLFVRGMRKIFPGLEALLEPAHQVGKAAEDRDSPKKAA